MVHAQEGQIRALTDMIAQKDRQIEQQAKDLESHPRFGVDSVLKKEDKLKDIFKYYTGITYVRFMGLLHFLASVASSPEYEKGRTDIVNMPDKDALFLTLCRLRHNYGLKDLAMRFSISAQSSGDRPC